MSTDPDCSRFPLASPMDGGLSTTAKLWYLNFLWHILLSKNIYIQAIIWIRCEKWVPVMAPICEHIVTYLLRVGHWDCILLLCLNFCNNKHLVCCYLQWNVHWSVLFLLVEYISCCLWWSIHFCTLYPLVQNVFMCTIIFSRVIIYMHYCLRCSMQATLLVFKRSYNFIKKVVGDMYHKVGNIYQIVGDVYLIVGVPP